MSHSTYKGSWKRKSSTATKEKKHIVINIEPPTLYKWIIILEGALLGVLLAAILISFSGCAAIESISLWQRQHNEAHYWQTTLRIIEEAKEGDPALATCYARIGEQPKTYYIPTLNDIGGQYDAHMRVVGSSTIVEQKAIVYKQEEALVHEYLHYLNDLNKPSAMCYDEFSSRLIQMLHNLEISNDRRKNETKTLKRQIRRQSGY